MDADRTELQLDDSERELVETGMLPDPLEQFQLWFEHAMSLGVPEVNAMCLATVDASGQPNARMVLLKGISGGGFVFFTNYRSRKARELSEVGRACLVFYWRELDRQVRIQGAVSTVTPEESDAYFSSRSRGHQLGAWASAQSTRIGGREELERNLVEVVAKFEGLEVPRPQHWGGYRLIPNSIEFWQEQPNRLHDRIVYSSTEAGWLMQRLSP